MEDLLEVLLLVEGLLEVHFPPGILDVALEHLLVNFGGGELGVPSLFGLVLEGFDLAQGVSDVLVVL